MLNWVTGPLLNIASYTFRLAPGRFQLSLGVYSSPMNLQTSEELAMSSNLGADLMGLPYAQSDWFRNGHMAQFGPVR